MKLVDAMVTTLEVTDARPGIYAPSIAWYKFRWYPKSFLAAISTRKVIAISYSPLFVSFICFSSTFSLLLVGAPWRRRRSLFSVA